MGAVIILMGSKDGTVSKLLQVAALSVQLSRDKET